MDPNQSPTPTPWQCPTGCPYQAGNAWVAVKVAGYAVTISVILLFAFKGDELEIDTKAAMLTIAGTGAGVAVDFKRFKDDALSTALKHGMKLLKKQ